MKKLTGLVLGIVLALGLCACGSNPQGTASQTEGEKTYTVGICQLVQHAALDAATQGFKDALNEALPGRVSFKEQNASGDTTNCATIVNGFVSSKVDLIMANATGALTAAASATNTIPILGTSVTAYGVALDLDGYTGTVGGNISGTSDLASLDIVAEMLHDWFPDAKKVGLLFCSAEANSRYQVDEMKTRLTKLGYSCAEYAFTDSNDLSAVTEAAVKGSDVIYIPTDNTAASNTEAIANVVLPAKMPVVSGDEGICAGCGVCTLAISYYDLGYTTGKMAARVLTGEADISTMPVEYTSATPKYNKANCELLGLKAPKDYTAIE